MLGVLSTGDALGRSDGSPADGEAVTRGHYIGEYVGELLDHAEGEQGANYTTIAGVAVCLSRPELMRFLLISFSLQV